MLHLNNTLTSKTSLQEHGIKHCIQCFMLVYTFLMFDDVTLETEDGETLKKYFNAAIEFAKNEFDTEVYAVCTDNDSKIVCGGRNSRIQEGKEPMQTTCMSHSASLFMKSLFAEKCVK